MRTGQAVGRTGCSTACCSVPMRLISAAFFQVVVLRRTHAAGQVLLGLVATFLVFIAALGRRSMVASLLGDEPNYPDHTGLWSFALDNVSYAPGADGRGRAGASLRGAGHGLPRAGPSLRSGSGPGAGGPARPDGPHFLFNTLNNLYALAQRPGADLSAPFMIGPTDALRGQASR